MGERFSFNITNDPMSYYGVRVLIQHGPQKASNLHRSFLNLSFDVGKVNNWQRHVAGFLSVRCCFYRKVGQQSVAQNGELGSP